ncbi:MAG: PASTA domain-containing protein [Muribaculaceae bacterium]|nr:PASTA domain-containing protein [Muribaculaceae bacterium]
MAKKKSKKKFILARYMLISGCVFLLAGLVVRNLFNTTIVNADKWNARAEKELSQSNIIYPERGDILASDGSVLATNLRFYTVRLDFRSERFKLQEYLDSIPMMADSLVKFFPGRASRKQWIDSLSKPAKKPADKRPRGYRVIDNLSYTDLQKIRTIPFFRIRNSNKNGFVVDSKVKREHPYGDMARRSIGGVGQTSKSSEVHGISGLECALDSLLYGKPGVSKKINLTRRIDDWIDTAAVPGYNIVTTIDINMQDIVENELNRVLEECDADWGVAVLMEVATGDIKAISNLEKSKKTGRYIEGMNRAVLGFEPGSVIKPISMLLALENGLVSNVNEVFQIGNSYAYANGKPITDSHYNSALTVEGIIEQSSNIGMTKVITRNNSIFHSHPSKFYDELDRIGFFEPMHTGIAGERRPVVEKKPSRLSLSRMCYGYATMIPPLYTLAIYNAIANNGRFVRPRLYSRLIGEEVDSVLPVTYVRDRICSEENALKLQRMLGLVVEGSHGTARRLKNDMVSIGGKTGTCYMVDPETRKYNTAHKRLAFCGFFPLEDPKYSCIVLTCRPRRNLMGAASTSGEVVKNIAVKMYSRGMLGNSSDYHTDQPPQGKTPHVYRTSKPDTYSLISSISGVKGDPSTPLVTYSKGFVPDVSGLGLREAVSIIESAGFNVSFSGRGYVNSQSPAPGTLSKPGSTVTIKLI